MRNLFALLVLLTLGLGQARADDIHVIIVGDTNDFSIGGGIAANVKQVKDFFELVRKSRIATKLNVLEIVGDDFSCDNINKAVADLVVTAKDTVFFYYAGHGFRRSTTQTKFPEFFCYPSSTTRIGAQLSKVVEAIESKQPRLTIAISDSCNNDDQLPPSAAFSPPIEFPENMRRALRHLFLAHRGRIVMSGSIPGDFSWYRKRGNDAGGFFTKQFMAELSSAIAASASPKWDAILEAATRPIPIPRNADPPIIQRPQFERELTPAP